MDLAPDKQRPVQGRGAETQRHLCSAASAVPAGRLGQQQAQHAVFAAGGMRPATRRTGLLVRRLTGFLGPTAASVQGRFCRSGWGCWLAGSYDAPGRPSSGRRVGAIAHVLGVVRTRQGAV
jgi:hypothetical protein